MPKARTLEDLAKKHDAFLNRLPGDGFRPVPPLSEFRVVGYRRATDPAPRPWAAFRLAAVDPDDRNPSFDTPRRCRDVAAWVRHATAQVCKDWPFGDVAGFVHGHGIDGKPRKGEGADKRFMYLPLPSIERRGDHGEHVGAIRRVLIAGPSELPNRIEWVRGRLPGQDLIFGGKVMGMLTGLASSDWVLRQYTGSGRVWSSVTPVIWSGYGSDETAKAERILRRAFVDAGLSQELIEGAELVWRLVGFRPGVEPATRYGRPDKLHGRMFHVRIRFPHAVTGPLAVGAGRYRGFGVFAVHGTQ